MVSGFCYLLPTLIGYRVIALILLLNVSFIAMLFDMKPVLAAAVLRIDLYIRSAQAIALRKDG